MVSAKNLKVSVEGKEIIKGLDLEIGAGEVHVLMGPNGSGKSTLAQIVAGHPTYRIENGELRFENVDIKKLSPDERAKLGIFLAFQNPVEIPGVSVFNFLRRAKQSSSLPLRAKRGNLKSRKVASSINPRNDLVSTTVFRQELLEYVSSLKLGKDVLHRAVNEGFSGGEKKRNEILQMMALKPKFVILDEIDSGLDVDGLKLVAQAIKKFSIINSQLSILIITHYARILKYIKSDFVHVMVDGKIVKSGKMSLAKEIEEKGYKSFQDVMRVKRSNLIRRSDRKQGI